MPHRVLRVARLTGALASLKRVFLLLILTAAAAASKPADLEEPAFLAENQAAMSDMMDGMAAPPAGDVDRDFVLMMVPHHRGAIAMARAELRHGRNEQLRRLAQAIIVDQGQEIVAMQSALSQPPAAAKP